MMRTIAGLAVAMSMPALATADEVVLRELFRRTASNGSPADWSADGPGWSVENGVLRGQSLDGETTILWDQLELRDVALSAEVRFTEARDAKRWFALLLREGGGNSPGVQLTVRRDSATSNGIELAAKSPGGDGWRVFQTASRSTAAATDHVFRVWIEARGECVRGYLDGEKMFDCPRGSEVTGAGRVGFRINGCAVRIEKVEVARLALLGPAELRHLRGGPLVIAHRGFSDRAPENTLAAYHEAIEAGADMAECDVWLSADRVPVLLHDENLKRTTGLDAPVTSVPLKKIKTLDAGSWKSVDYSGECIPTLIEALKLIDGRLRLIIEIKPTGMEHEVIEAIREAGVKPSDVMIFSFKRDVVETMSRIEPGLPTTWLIGDMPWDEPRRRELIAEAVQARVSAIGLPKTRVDPAIVRLAHESGLPVFVWTVNDTADMRYLVRIGVDGIITDRPDALVRILETTD